ncbi:unnamed protein product [Discosporangium mesarthrocarpum]
MVKLCGGALKRCCKPYGPQEWTTGNCLSFFHVKSTLRKAQIEEWGYNLHTHRGRRDWCATILLSMVLIAIALVISGLTDSLHLVNVETSLCTGTDEKVAENLQILYEVTNYTAAIQAKDDMMGLMANTYDAAGARYVSPPPWPEPYRLTPEERAKLEAAAEDGGLECEYREVCAKVFGGCFGLGVCEQCKWVRVPCPDVEAKETLLAYDASHQALDIYGETFPPEIDLNTTVVESFINGATEAISDFMFRINVASSVYVIYLAITLFVAPALVVYGTTFKNAIFQACSALNKPVWVLLFIVIWYLNEAITAVLKSAQFTVVWANFVKDPCWANPDFLVQTSQQIAEVCNNITFARNLFLQAGANYKYYSKVEATWLPTLLDDQSFLYDSVEHVENATFPGFCDKTAMSLAIEPSNGQVNWGQLFLKTGALVALLLQVALAHWFVSWFSLLRPLIKHRGRVLIPRGTGAYHSRPMGDEDHMLKQYSQSDDGTPHGLVTHREVIEYARLKAILPFLVSTGVLIFLLVNVAITDVNQYTFNQVFITVVILCAFQFILVPILIGVEFGSAEDDFDPQGWDEIVPEDASEEEVYEEDYEEDYENPPKHNSRRRVTIAEPESGGPGESGDRQGSVGAGRVLAPVAGVSGDEAKGEEALKPKRNWLGRRIQEP